MRYPDNTHLWEGPRRECPQGPQQSEPFQCLETARRGGGGGGGAAVGVAGVHYE